MKQNRLRAIGKGFFRISAESGYTTATCLRRIEFHLRKSARRKCKRFRHKPKGARGWFAGIIWASLALFAHW